jgi:hypothetical protein
MPDGRIIDRIKKLLRLARGMDNEKGGGLGVEETANAAAHAQRLMAKYQIEEAQLGDLDDDGSGAGVNACMGDDGLYRGRNLPFWICRLAACLADLNNCDSFIQISGRERIIGIVGGPVETSVVRYMFDYLRKEIAKLCRQHPQRKNSPAWRTDFKLGATDQVILRMKDARQDEFHDAPPQALARLSAVRKAAKAWTEEHVTKKAEDRKRRPPDPNGYMQGRVAGQGIQLETEMALPEGAESDV